MRWSLPAIAVSSTAGPIAGVLLDRLERKHVLLASDLGLSRRAVGVSSVLNFAQLLRHVAAENRGWGSLRSTTHPLRSAPSPGGDLDEVKVPGDPTE